MKQRFVRAYEIEAPWVRQNADCTKQAERSAAVVEFKIMGPKPGAVFAVRTQAGVAHVQWTHRDRQFGPLLRILPGIHSGPVDVSALVAKPAVGWVLANAPHYYRRGDIEYVGPFPIPESALAYPALRMRLGGAIVSGVCQVHTEVGPQARWMDADDATRMPVFSLANLGGMVDTIYRANGRDPSILGPNPLGHHAASPNVATSEHSLYFPTEATARAAAAALAVPGYTTCVEDRGEFGWLVLYRESTTTTAEIVEARLVSVAEEFGGTYDGHEMPLS